MKSSNQQSKRLRSEGGFVLLIGTLVTVGILLLMFATIQYGFIVAESLKNYYVTIQAVQGMVRSSPAQLGALNQAAAIAHLNGYTGALAQTGTQSLSGIGSITLNYDTSMVPHKVSVRLEKDVGFMAGMFSSLGAGLGLKLYTVKSELSGSSEDSLISFHIDTGANMRGPINQAKNSNQPLISKLLTYFNLPFETNTSAFCYPIKINTTGTTYAQRLQECYQRRSRLPFYWDKPPAPIGHNYDVARPGPPPGQLGDQPAQFSPLPNWTYLNPNVNYTNTNITAANVGIVFTPTTPPIDNALVCGNPIDKPNGCVPNGSPSCFPLQAGTQAAVMPPGYTMSAWNRNPSNASSCIGNPGAGCATIPSSSVMVTDRYCVLPFTGTSDDMSPLEQSFCPGMAAVDSLPNPGECSTQLGWLKHARSDTYLDYMEVNQVLLMHAAEMAPLIDLNIVTGPTDYGRIAEQDTSSGSPKPIWGNKKLFDSVQIAVNQGVKHIFTHPIDNRIKAMQYYKVPVNVGGVVVDKYISSNIRDDFGYQVRKTLMQAYLPSSQFRMLNPASGITSAAHSLPGATKLLALENPFRPSPVGQPYYYRGTMHLNEVGYRPIDPPGSGPTGLFPGYTLVKGDIWGEIATDRFPATGAQVAYSAQPFLSPSWDNQFDFPQLIAVDEDPASATYGQQTGAPLDPMPKTVNTAIKWFVDTMPGYGGGDIWGALRTAADSCENAQTYFPGIFCQVVLITDGSPKDICAAPSDPPVTCNTIPTGSLATINSPGNLFYNINSELNRLHNMGALVLLLFMDLDWTPNTSTQNDFISLFENKAAFNRAALKFDFDNPTQFSGAYRKALKLIRGMLSRPARLLNN